MSYFYLKDSPFRLLSQFSFLDQLFFVNGRHFDLCVFFGLLKRFEKEGLVVGSGEFDFALKI